MRHAIGIRELTLVTKLMLASQALHIMQKNELNLLTQ